MGEGVVDLKVEQKRYYVIETTYSVPDKVASLWKRLSDCRRRLSKTVEC